MFYVVPQGHCLIVERLGRFSRVQQSGLRVRLPFLESVRRVGNWQNVASKQSMLIELSEQQTDTDPRVCQTRDNATVTANATVYWRIVDPRKAVYEVDILPRSVTDVALNALRANIGAMDLDEVLSKRAELSDRIAAQLAQTAAKWGILFTRVEIQNLETTEEVSSAMLRQMDAERRRRAAVIDAEGKATADVRIAESDKQAAILRAEGRARSLELLAEAELNYLRIVGANIGPEAAARLLQVQKALDALTAISQNPAHKVFLPNSLGGLTGLTQVVGELVSRTPSPA